MNGLFRKVSATVAVGTTLAVAVGSALALAPPKAKAKGSPRAQGNSSKCPTYPLSQPFLAWSDNDQYTLFSGQTVDNVTGAGWRLSKGARLVTTVLQDGQRGQVLDLPAGSSATTPPMCVAASNYPTARGMLADLHGKVGLAVRVSYQGARGHAAFSAGMIKNTAGGWYPSRSIQLHSHQLRGDHLVQLTFVVRQGHYQLYNLYIDPRRGH